MNLNSPERFPVLFERRISNNYSDFFVITNSNDDFIGFLISYDYSPNDMHLKIMEYIEPAFRNGIYTTYSLVSFLHTLFTHYNLRKVYTEVYEYNTDSLRSHCSFGFSEEAKLKEYRYYNQKYWNFIIFSITKEGFYERYGKVISKFFADHKID